jgi:hypothetical protein
LQILRAGCHKCVALADTTERFKLKLISYERRTEVTRLIEIDRTEFFTQRRFHQESSVATNDELKSVI